MNASENNVRIKVIGVGGAGCNAVDRMMQIGIAGIQYIAANTDAQALSNSAAHKILPLGPETTRSLGAGGIPEVGRKAAEESKEAIAAELNDTDMLFIAAGMGGGTGTGAAPVIAEIAHKKGILTIGIVSQPFSFEGSRRSQAAQEGVEKLRAQADTLIIVPNDKLLKLCDKMSTLDEALRMADDVLRQGVQGIAELVTHPGLINLDFASVRSILHQAGPSLFSIGYGEGENKALAAAQSALENPLLDIKKTQEAAGLLVNMTRETI